MPKYKIAHLREQGQDMIIVPLESSFGSRSSSDQTEFIHALQMRTVEAGLAGKVVPVWRAGSGHQFIAPRQWQGFFKSFSWNAIMASINKELSCD